MALWTQIRKLGGGVSDIDELKSHFADLFARFGSPPAGVGFEAGQFGLVHGEWARVLRDPSDAPVKSNAGRTGRTILYFHGGCFVAGSPQTHRPLIGRLAEACSVNIFAVRYRLAPENVFPAAVRDGIDAYRGLLGLGISPASIVLGGDGSGGGLAFSVLLAIRNAGLPMPAAILALSPWADLSLSGWSLLANQKADNALQWELLFQCARHYLRKSNPSDAYASPAFASFKDFPPIMVHAGAAEILRDDASKLGDRAADAGVPVSVEIYDGMGHLFQAAYEMNEAKVSLARLGQFVRTKATTA